MKKWSEIIEAKRDEIYDALKQATEETYKTMSGWHVDVEIDEDKVWVTELMSVGSQSRSSWEGESFVVKSIPSWQLDIDYAEWLKNGDEEDKKIYAEFKENEDDWYCMRDFLEGKYRDKLEEIEESEKEFEMAEENWDAVLDEIILEQKRYENRGY